MTKQTTTIHVGDCIAVLRTLPERSVQCVVTSPPYWGLRSYAAGKEFATKPEADAWSVATAIDWQATYASDVCRYEPRPSQLRDGLWHGSVVGVQRWADGTWCEYGLEPTPEDYLAHTVEVFREVRRVMRDDATLWLNLGDSYANSGCGGGSAVDVRKDGRPTRESDKVRGREHTRNYTIPPGLKPKDLVGIPWRVALALQADGWWLRSDIIWAKPNPMPESCTDRPTKSHEYMFLLTKAARYFYDADAVREALSRPNTEEGFYGDWAKVDDGRTKSAHRRTPPSRRPGYIGPENGRNLRDVWTIATESFKEAHFATYPRRLVEPCIKAGTSDKGACPACGAPWTRIVERKTATPGQAPGYARDCTGRNDGDRAGHFVDATSRSTGWSAGCDCAAEAPGGVLRPVPCVVLDPFTGSGTTGVVAKQLGRAFVGVELNPEYARMARNRIANPEPERPVADVPGQELLFDIAV